MIEKDDLTEKKRNRFKKKLVEDLSENIKLRFPALSYKHDVLYTSDVYSHTHVRNNVTLSRGWIYLPASLF